LSVRMRSRVVATTAVLGFLCGVAPAAAQQGSAPVPSQSASAAANSQVETAIARAQSQVGIPYAWGGGNAFGPTAGVRDGASADAFGDFRKVGFDCSGLVQYAFSGAGIQLPQYTGHQYLRGEHVAPQDMQRGDLIFYGPDGSAHVAIYLGDGTMVEAPTSGGVVQETPVRWEGMSEHVVRLI
jgi:peptidoglycan DL-endopeptidase RipA